ncbi:hypothetical protein QTI51_32570, partial [Variovorax sp. J22G73]|uniref:hypothetical protein n=1 Tax=unclassified Variovorax TaxID=663243 RepID=UPI002574E0F1
FVTPGHASSSFQDRVCCTSGLKPPLLSFGEAKESKSPAGASPGPETKIPKPINAQPKKSAQQPDHASAIGSHKA